MNADPFRPILVTWRIAGTLALAGAVAAYREALRVLDERAGRTLAGAEGIAERLIAERDQLQR